MKTCKCQPVYPHFIRSCLQCGNDFGPSKVDSDELVRKLRGGNSFSRAMMRNMGYPSGADADARFRGDVLRECQMYYDMHAGKLQGRFRRETVEEMLRPMMQPPLQISMLERRGQEVIEAIFSIGDLGSEYREKQRQEQERREAEHTAAELRGQQANAWTRELAEERRRIESSTYPADIKSRLIEDLERKRREGTSKPVTSNDE